MSHDPADRLLTIPNALSVLRLLGVPLFLYLLLGPHADGWALVVLVAAGLSDWLDGKIARWLDQASRLGALLDPAADRLYILATLVAFVVRGIVPWWVAAVLVGRELVVGLCLPVLRARGYGPFEVNYLGKAATFNLLYAFPMLLARPGLLHGRAGRPPGRLRVHGLGRGLVPVVGGAVRVPVHRRDAATAGCRAGVNDDVGRSGGALIHRH